MIEVKHLNKSFGSFQALNNLSMSVPRGSVYGLVGPNGAGKSTLLRHLVGVYRPDSGRITVDGSPVYNDPDVKGKIAFIPDEIFYYTGSTMEDMHRFYRGLYPKFDEALYQRLKEAFPLPSGPIRRFSKGMQKQGAFHLALACRPEVLILDEPVDGLDPVMRRQVMSLILSDVAEHDTTVVISSHNLRELEDVCDRVGIMNKGSMLMERSLADMQGNTVKVQIVGDLPAGLDILHSSVSGRMHTHIVRGSQEKVFDRISAVNPTYFDVLPLSLEEIFIYELGGVNYEVKSIVL